MKLKKLPYLLIIIVTICLITSCNKKCKHQSTYWEIDKQATCTEDGSKHKECTVCHEKLDTEVIESLGHDLVHHEKQDPTCTEKGHKAYDTCTRCSYTTYEELSAIGHTESEWIIDKQATCMKIGIKHKECTVCHEKLDTEVIESLGHDLVHHEKENPTCTKKGHKAYDTCTRCDYTTYEELPAIGHTKSDWIIDKQATCTNVGSKHKECTVCHEKLVTEVIESLGHDLVHHEKKDPTCTEKGYKEYYTCTRCSYTTYEELPATGHTESNWIIDKQATCTNDGSKHKECTICHEKLDTEVIESLGHDLVHHEKKDPTCTEKGYKEYYTCTKCSYTTYEEIPELGHIYEDGICTRCGYELTSSDLLYELTSDNTGYIVTGLDYSKYDFNALTIIIPSEYKGLPIVGIEEEAFKNRIKIKKIILSNYITHIGNAAFEECKRIANIVLPNSVTSIGDSAFSGCTGLTSIEIPNSVITIGRYVFLGCSSLKSIIIPDSVTTMGKAIFENSTNLESVTIPFVGDGKNNAYFGYMFGASNYDDNSQYVPILLKKVIITNVTSISSFAFSGCADLTSIVIPNSVTSIGESAFGGCRSLTNIEIPDSVTSIGNSAFDGCKSLANIEIPDSVTSIGCGAFLGCTNLTIIVLPNKIKNIGSDAFFDCISLTNVYYEGIIEDWCNISFKSVASNPMYYASHFYMLDKNNEYKEITEIVIPETITIIGNYQFYGFNYIKSIIIPNSVTSIGLIVFSSCTGLTSIIVNENNPIYDSRDNCNAIIETKTNTLIYGCNNTIIPNTVTTIERGAFYRCTGITSMKIPNNVTNIGEFAFCGCASLTNIVIPNSVTSIEMCAFDGCTSLTSIVIPDSVTSIEFYAFGNCTGLTIYCETLEQPSGWDDDWNPNICKVVWGYKK